MKRDIEIKVTFLGTGTSQGIPVIGCNCEVCCSDDERDQRLRTSILITTGEVRLVVDCGPDFRQQMLRTHTVSLDAILITHEHNDHVIGLDDVRPFNFKAGKDMSIYATSRVQEELKRRFAYIFKASPYPGAPKVRLHTIVKTEPFKVLGIEILPIEVMHGNLPVLGFRIGDFTYLTDASNIALEELEKVKGSRVIVLNALRRKPHHSHLNLEQALQLVDKIGPERAFLTHISHRMGLHAEVSKELPSHVWLAYDGLEVVLKN